MADVDCDDTDPAINPAAPDLPGNSLDEDCDGAPACDPAAAWRTPGALRACVATTCARLVAAGTVDAAFCARLQQSLTAADGSFPEAAHRR